MSLRVETIIKDKGDFFATGIAIDFNFEILFGDQNQTIEKKGLFDVTTHFDKSIRTIINPKTITESYYLPFTEIIFSDTTGGTTFTLPAYRITSFDIVEQKGLIEFSMHGSIPRYAFDIVGNVMKGKMTINAMESDLGKLINLIRANIFIENQFPIPRCKTCKGLMAIKGTSAVDEDLVDDDFICPDCYTAANDFTNLLLSEFDKITDPSVMLDQRPFLQQFINAGRKMATDLDEVQLTHYYNILTIYLETVSGRMAIMMAVSNIEKLKTFAEQKNLGGMIEFITKMVFSIQNIVGNFGTDETGTFVKSPGNATAPVIQPSANDGTSKIAKALQDSPLLQEEPALPLQEPIKQPEPFKQPEPPSPVQEIVKKAEISLPVPEQIKKFEPLPPVQPHLQKAPVAPSNPMMDLNKELSAQVSSPQLKKGFPDIPKPLTSQKDLKNLLSDELNEISGKSSAKFDFPGFGSEKKPAAPVANKAVKKTSKGPRNMLDDMAGALKELEGMETDLNPKPISPLDILKAVNTDLAPQAQTNVTSSLQDGLLDLDDVELGEVIKEGEEKKEVSQANDQEEELSGHIMESIKVLDDMLGPDAKEEPIDIPKPKGQPSAPIPKVAGLPQSNFGSPKLAAPQINKPAAPPPGVVPPPGVKAPPGMVPPPGLNAPNVAAPQLNKPAAPPPGVNAPPGMVPPPGLNAPNVAAPQLNKPAAPPPGINAPPGMKAPPLVFEAPPQSLQSDDDTQPQIVQNLPVQNNTNNDQVDQNTVNVSDKFSFLDIGSKFISGVPLNQEPAKNEPARKPEVSNQFSNIITSKSSEKTSNKNFGFLNQPVVTQDEGASQQAESVKDKKKSQICPVCGTVPKKPSKTCPQCGTKI